MSEIVKIYEDDKYKLVIEYDEYVESPRVWDNTCRIVCCERSTYAHLGDEQTSMSLLDKMEELRNRDDVLAARYVYAYVHSGMTISLEPFSCRWDSGTLGIIYITEEDFIKMHGYPEDFELDKFLDHLMHAEIDEYDQYICGEIYRFCLYEKDKCDCCGHVEEELIDSCGGFYGLDMETNGILDAIVPSCRYLLSIGEDA